MSVPCWGSKPCARCAGKSMAEIGNRKERLRNYASFPDWGEAPSFPLRVSSSRRFAAAQMALGFVLGHHGRHLFVQRRRQRGQSRFHVICTVDLDTPSTLAVFLTAPVAAIYSARAAPCAPSPDSRASPQTVSLFRAIPMRGCCFFPLQPFAYLRGSRVHNFIILTQPTAIVKF